MLVICQPEGSDSSMPACFTTPVCSQFAEAVRRGKGGDDIFLDPWWLFGPKHEVTTNKRLWDMGAELVENIPHSLEVSFETVLLRKAEISLKGNAHVHCQRLEVVHAVLL